MEQMIQWADFEKIEMRVGTIIQADEFPEARKPAFRLRIDFGEFGIKSSSAQITKLYTLENLVGRRIIAVVNFPVKKIASFESECLVLGVIGDAQGVTLLTTDFPVSNGLRIA